MFVCFFFFSFFFFLHTDNRSGNSKQEGDKELTMNLVLSWWKLEQSFENAAKTIYYPLEPNGLNGKCAEKVATNP